MDSAREFCSIPADAIKAVEETLHGIRGNYLQGVVTVRERLVFLIDVSAVLAPEEVELPAQTASLPFAAKA